MQEENNNETLPLLNPRLDENSTFLRSAASSTFNGLKSASYHSIDYIRIALVTQSLMGRWLWQFFLELDRYGWAPEKSIQQTWVGWPIIAAAFGAALAAKGVNAYFRKKDKHFTTVDESKSFTDVNYEDYLQKKTYFAGQDYLYGIFSSSMLYFIMDTLSSTGNIGSLPLAAFIATTVLVPGVSLVSARYALPDTTDRLIVHPKQLSGCPEYTGVDKVEKGLNSLTGLIYGASVFVLFWTIDREIHDRTSSLPLWQFLVAGLYTIANGIVGSQLTSFPKLFHGVVASSKALRDGALSYAALSGIAYHFMTGVTQCNTGMCWEEDINTGLTGFFLPIAIAIGLFSAMTSIFRYDEKHQSYVDNKEMILNFPSKVKETGLRAVDCCDSLFNRCSGSDKEGLDDPEGFFTFDND